jgi:RNA 2',3'-cyclic 3'-phosphodiesterase
VRVTDDKIEKIPVPEQPEAVKPETPEKEKEKERENQKKLRLFLAVNLSVASTRKIAEALPRMRATAQVKGMRVAWVPPANLHITLKFLGWANPELVDAIRDKVAAIVSGTRSFDVAARGAGAYPDAAHARILWIGVQDPSGTLAKIAAAVDAAMVALGFPSEGRAFSAHVTVGRVKEGKGAEDVLAPHRQTDFGSSLVREVVLYQSQMKSKGSEYISLWRVPFDSAPYRAERQTRGVEEETTDEG